MDAITKLKTEVNLVEHISNTLGQKGKKETQGFRFKSSVSDKTPSLLVYEDQAKGYMDFSGRLGGGTIIDFTMAFMNCEMKDAIKILCEKYRISDDDKKEFKKAPKRHILAEKFEDFRMTGTNNGFIRFLGIRGIKHDFISENKDIISELVKEFGFCEGIWTNKINDKGVYKDLVIFPCLKNGEICGAKIRTTDGSKFLFGNKELKSVSIGKPKDYSGKFPFSTGLIYKKEDLKDDAVLITEGETDYLILKLLGFKSVIGNLGGVSANADEIQKLVKNTKKIICLYDNDNAGRKGAESLQEKIGRPIRKVLYPEIDGVDKYDINDLFNMGYGNKELLKLFNEALLLDDEKFLKEQPLFRKRFFYDSTKLEYFDLEDLSFVSGFQVSRHVFLKQSELEEMREGEAVPTYKGICYLDGGKKGFFNLLDKSGITQPSKTPKVHPAIIDLLKNICNNDRENLMWLLEAIAYKYTHLNDVYIPAVIFHGVGGTGKGLLMKLLENIFGVDNTQIGLTQDSLESRFSAYTGRKLIVEMKELSADNTAQGKRNMQKLKTIIMEDKIVIEKKGKDPVGIDNIAWFIMSSNENKPVILDSADSGNRRFAIIRTGGKIERLRGKEIADAIGDKENIENFIAWLLMEKFPDIKEQKYLTTLENQDKRDLERLSEPVGNLFFKWFEEKYPDINKISTYEFKQLVDTYRIENSDEDFNDPRYKISNFNNGLSMRYKPSFSFKRDGKTYRGYKIIKEVKGKGYFDYNKFEFYKDK